MLQFYLCLVSVSAQKFEFLPHSQQWEDVCGRTGGALMWMESVGLKYATTQQLIIQEGYMLQFKVNIPYIIIKLKKHIHIKFQ